MTIGEPDGRRVAFEPDGDELVVRDVIDVWETTLGLSGDVTPEPALTELFLFPVDDAVSVRTEWIEIGGHAGASVWDADGTHQGSFDREPRRFPRGTYYVGIQAPFKLYLRIPDAELVGRYDDHTSPDRSLRLELDEPRTISVGARSTHARPEETITVSDDPAALIEALPYMASSIREFSPERSWPTLRGHPPAIELGESLSIPSSLTAPDTGIDIAVPPTFADVYRIAPLAYYLGASVVPGDAAELRLDGRYTEPLGTGRELARTADDLLRRCLLLDSLARVEGYFTNPRLAYDELASHLPFYPPNLYEASIPEAVMEYLEVEPSLLEQSLPSMPGTAVLRDRVDDAACLPSLLDRLWAVRVTPAGRTVPPNGDSRGSLPGHLVAHTDGLARPNRSIVAPDTFRTVRTRTLPASEAVTMVSIVEDPERGHQVDETVTELATAEGIPTDVASTLVAPDIEEIRATTASGVDLWYWEQPTVDEVASTVRPGSCDADSGPAAGPHLFVVVADDPAAVGSAWFDAVGFGGVALEEPPTRSTLRAFLRCLFRGHVLTTSVRFAGLGQQPYFFGDATQPLLSLPGGCPPLLLDVRSRGPDTHEVTVHAQPFTPIDVGAVVQVTGDHTADSNQLAGTTPTQPFRYTTEEVIELLADDNYVIRLNGRPYHGVVDATPEFVRQSAREVDTVTPAESNTDGDTGPE